MSDSGLTKYCPDCRLHKATCDFTKDSRRKDGLSFYCAACRRLRDNASRAAARRRRGARTHRGSLRPTVVPDGKKWCPECGEIMVLQDFPRNRSQRGGYGTYCKPCHNRITRENKEKNGGARNYHLRRRYGITVEHFDAMFAEQDGLCAICREAPAEHVDHNHDTGRVRGLLCFNCNGALGQFRDRRDLMLRAIAYLGRTAGEPMEVPGFRLGLVPDGPLFDDTNSPPPPEPGVPPESTSDGPEDTGLVA